MKKYCLMLVAVSAFASQEAVAFPVRLVVNNSFRSNLIVRKVGQPDNFATAASHSTAHITVDSSDQLQFFHPGATRSMRFMYTTAADDIGSASTEPENIMNIETFVNSGATGVTTGPDGIRNININYPGLNLFISPPLPPLDLLDEAPGLDQPGEASPAGTPESIFDAINPSPADLAGAGDSEDTPGLPYQAQ